MGLNYKILWFEDNGYVIDDHLPEVRKFLEDKGFSLEVKNREDSSEIETILNEDYDLILSDINLAEGEAGNQIIQEIRKRHIYTEVLFYSGNAHGINEVMKNESIERVSFCVGLENLLDKITHVISLTLKKLQEVNSIRGLFMAETSELDVKMTEIIVSLFGSFDEEVQKEKKEELINKTIENRARRLEQLKQTNVTDNIKPFVEKLESNDRISSINRIVNYIHQKNNNQTFRENKNILTDYNADILHVRNTLAHAKELNVDGVKKVISSLTGAEVNFDDDSCKTMRKNIKKHRDNLDDIIVKVSKL